MWAMSAAQEQEHTEQRSHDPALTVKTDVYEGPLEVLLTLIQKRKLFINDVSLSQVTDDFIAYIQQQEEFPVETSTQFLGTASTLMLLKSKSLLPSMDLSDDEEGDIEELQDRLQMYQRIKNVSEHIWSRWGTQPLHNRSRKPQAPVTFSPTDEIEPDRLLGAMRRVLERLPSDENIAQTQVHERVSLKETIDSLTDRMQRAMRTSFSGFSGYEHGKEYTREERLNVVVSFLAMLELVKTGIVEARQGEHYDDIELARAAEYDERDV